MQWIVILRSRVGISWSGDISRDAEQGAKGVEAAVESEDGFVLRYACRCEG
jgi:hypothetical protein